MTFTHSADHQVLAKHTYAGPSPILGRPQASLYTYGYDADNRLTNVTYDTLFPAGKYGYDAAGNLLQYQDGATFNAAANDLNQLSIVNGKAWQYDADGNLINDGQHAYTWDAANQLVKVTNLKTGNVTTYGYDGLGRRLVIGEQATGGGTSSTFYLWCGNKLCGSRNAVNEVTADYYAQGEQQDHYTQAGQQSTSDLYYMRDRVGSVVGVLGANGALRGSTDYTEYGAIRKTVGASASFGYAGIFYDATTGLYLTKYREYAPNAGRWLSRDPIGRLGGGDVYAYAYGDPTGFTDRDGRDPIGAVVGFVGGAIWGGVSGWISGDRDECLYIDIGMDAAVGGLAGLTDGFSLLAVGARAGIAAGGEAGREYANGENLNGGDIAAAAVGSAIGDVVGGKAVSDGLGDFVGDKASSAASAVGSSIVGGGIGTAYSASGASGGN